MANIVGTDGRDFIHPTQYGSVPGYNDIPLATAGDDTADGGGGDDYVYGGDGNDTLSGGAGNDVLYGGNGDDLLLGVANGGDVFYGGLGRDTLSYAGSATGTTAAVFATSSVEVLTGSGFDDILFGDSGTDLNGGDGNDELVARGGIADGGNGNDKISGLGGTLLGGAGNDHLSGSAVEQSILIGGAGADRLEGADYSQPDQVPFATIVSYAGNAVAVSLNLGNGVAVGGDATGDTLVNIDGVIGSAFDDRMTGNAVANWLRGGAGNDILAGAGGADRLEGGDGIDTVLYTDSTVGVRVDLGLGTGHGGTAEGDALSGVESVIGSSHDDILTGDGGVNGVWGGLGSDTLAGGAGNDALKGEAGDDVLAGGLGADTLVGGDGSDTASYRDSLLGVTIDLGTNLNRFGEAQGDILSGIENLAGSAMGDRLAGDGGANALSGAGGNDLLTGGSGADMLTGGAGADIFACRAVGDSTVGAAGQDTIVDFNDLDGDKIDLRAIDADGNEGNGDQAFTFIGGDPFSGQAGQVRVTDVGEALLVEGDVNGNGTADFAIRVEGIAELSATDFYL
jgi:Ca2+-binding RTX toxin-like protein